MPKNNNFLQMVKIHRDKKYRNYDSDKMTAVEIQEGSKYYGRVIKVFLYNMVTGLHLNQHVLSQPLTLSDVRLRLKGITKVASSKYLMSANF